MLPFVLKRIGLDPATSSALFVATLVNVTGADGVARAAASVSVDSFTQLSATFAEGTVAPGVYSVRVRHPNGATDTLAQAFTLVRGGQPKLETNLVLPSTRAVGREDDRFRRRGIFNLVHFGPVRDVPNSDRLVFTGRGELHAIRAEREAAW